MHLLSSLSPSLSLSPSKHALTHTNFFGIASRLFSHTVAVGGWELKRQSDHNSRWQSHLASNVHQSRAFYPHA